MFHHSLLRILYMYLYEIDFLESLGLPLLGAAAFT